ncbi:hypothetical protein [Rhizobium oryzicola]|uniref:Uncharacterized protein n=1 Tax=Rhizobium oryzicola TaxID=1232668 RepID=A0ABT8T172_9HYPH|nr:hypothetical protein [Rhizobium oryzicola]MDO1583883.1 hypothetical protein [Rhizobium oryzicola]
MRTMPLALILSILTSGAFAAEATDPVKQVMDMTKTNWESVDADWKFIFDADPLSKLYSKRFQAAYNEAAKHPAYETENNQPGDPFGYDVITDSQDGCPLKDVTIASAGTKDNVTDVKVTFKLWTCIDDPQIKDTVNEVHFDVITEDGKPVIDDIHRVADNERDSVFKELQELAKGQ